MNDQKRLPNLRLKQERELCGWSQEDLAEKVGTTQKIVSRWERGESHPVPYYRQKLCKLFGKNARALGFLDDPQEENSELADIPEKQSRASISLDRHQPIQLFIPNNTPHVVTVHIQQQAPITASVSSEENAIIDSGMTTTLGHERPRETEGTVKRREFFQE